MTKENKEQMKEELNKEVMDDDSWAYEIQIMEGYSSGEVQKALGIAIDKCIERLE